jgi:hypothetical protein
MAKKPNPTDVWHIFSTCLARGRMVKYAAVRVERIQGTRDANWFDAQDKLPRWWHQRWYEQLGLCREDCAVVAHCRPHSDVIVWKNREKDDHAWALGDIAQGREIFRG